MQPTNYGLHVHAYEVVDRGVSKSILKQFEGLYYTVNVYEQIQLIHIA